VPARIVVVPLPALFTLMVASAAPTGTTAPVVNPIACWFAHQDRIAVRAAGVARLRKPGSFLD
jgi:hypothetical protein